MTERKLFVAGATGAVGGTVTALAQARGVALVPHVRPKSAGRAAVAPNAAVLELGDTPALVEAMRGCTTVLQLIGTMRKRFASGDTYETSDVGTTQQLVAAAQLTGVDHFILLSSVGAGRPMGAYLKAKARAEKLVLDSKVPFTILRPSAFIGAGHSVPAPVVWMADKLNLRRYRPIRVEDLAAALLHAAVRRHPVGRILEGESLWELVRAATS